MEKIREVFLFWGLGYVGHTLVRCFRSPCVAGGRRHLHYCLTSFPFNYRSLDLWEMIIRQRGHRGFRRTSDHRYLVTEVGWRSHPGRTVDGRRQLLQICHHAVAARVEGHRDFNSICCLQTPARHVYKLEHSNCGF